MEEEIKVYILSSTISSSLLDILGSVLLPFIFTHAEPMDIQEEEIVGYIP